MKSKASKILLSVFGFILIVFVLYQACNSWFDDKTYCVAQQVTVNDTIEAQGIIIRQETVLQKQAAGIQLYSVSNGSRVAQNATVLEYFENDADVQLRTKINVLQQKIEALQELDDQNKIATADMDTNSTLLKNTVLDLQNQICSQSFSQLDDTQEQLLYLLNQRQLATGQVADFSAQIQKYAAQLETLQQQYRGRVDFAQSPSAGYFVNEADGYETALSYENATQLQVSDLENVQPKQIPSDCIGKVITDIKWYLAAVVNADQVHELTEGDVLDVQLPLTAASQVQMTVEAINSDDASGKAAIILSCSNMNSQLCSARLQTVQLVMGSYTGLKIDAEAVRIVDGQKGVYVQSGAVTKFYHVDVSYYGDGFVIVDSNNGNNELKIYDDVIIGKV